MIINKENVDTEKSMKTLPDNTLVLRQTSYIYFWQIMIQFFLVQALFLSWKIYFSSQIFIF